MGTHSLNSPSSFSRRIGCPGSARMEAPIPSKSSSFAAEGTAAHELGEKCLLTGKDPHEFKDEIIVVEDQQFTVTQDMIDAVEVYVDYCRSLGGEPLIEEKFDLPFLGEDQKGTSDFTTLSQRILNVVDYKHGKGVPVEAKGNVQGTCYGLGAVPLFEDKEWDVLRITIVQPRAYHDEGPIRSWDIPREDLFDIMMQYAFHAKETERPDAELAVGDWCRFCEAKPTCPAQLEFVEVAMDTELFKDEPNPIPLNLLTDSQIAELVLSKIPLIKQWCASLEDYAQSKAEAGSPLPGTKLVKTRAKRIWKNSGEAEEFFRKIVGDKAYAKKFLSAPQMEKVIGKKEFKNYENMVDKISTGVTLVAESDERPSARSSAELEFAT